MTQRRPSKKRSVQGSKSDKQGRRAEKLCILFLRLKGYKIIAQRYKTHQGEIDIVAVRGKVLAFVEVKSRPDYRTGLEAVSPDQQRRMGRTAALFHAHHRGYSRYDMRFDVMVILPWHFPIHIQNAFPCAMNG